MSNYWKICIEEALSESKITATQEQIDEVISWVEGAHENYDLQHGHECIPNPLQLDNDSLRRELNIEKNKIHCETCNGRGRIIENMISHSSNTECWKCRGEGRLIL